MDINKYLKLNLSDKEPDQPEKYDTRILELLENANRELEKYYSGKYKFNICEDGIDPNNLRLSPKKKRRIKEIWLKFDSDLSEVQRKYERYLQNSMEDK